MLLGVDVGGTFTDAVLFDGQRLLTGKAPTTPHDQSQGVLAAVREVLEQAGRGAEEVERFSHGMTVATNALLEGRGARTALIATEGFEDIVELGRQNRAELYRLCAARPAPLVPPQRRFGAPERMTPDGPLRELTAEAADTLAREATRCEPEAIAVTLLHSYRHPAHEQLIRDALSHHAPHVSVHLSYETVGTFREYERAATTEVDAALSPLLRNYLERLVERAAEAGLPTPSIMQSNGGLIDPGAASSHASWTVLSGPAGGAAAAAHVARAAGTERVLCFDMGGTSCDICVIEDGEVHEREQGEIGDRPLALPMLAIHTVGAGGGSIAWRDRGGALRVGPQSAGADPGPACYGRGGSQPTVTDANLLLGHLDPGAPLAGDVRLDIAAAERAVGALADELDLSREDCAAGIIRVANAEMVRALRVVTVERGIDPREHSLMCFGGAGPLHAAAIAEELGIKEILCPRASGVLAALGLVVAPRRRDAQRSVLLSGEELQGRAISRIAEELAVEARERLGADDAELRVIYALRYQGQAFELPVAGSLEADPEQLRREFDALHASRYGYHDDEAILELVTIRVTATQPGPEVPLRVIRKARWTGLSDESLESGEPQREPESAEPRRQPESAGRQRIPLPESTLVVPGGWEVADLGDVLRLRRGPR